MLLLALLVGMVAYIIIRLQMVNIELTWLRKYIMRLLTNEIRGGRNIVHSEEDEDEEKRMYTDEHFEDDVCVDVSETHVESRPQEAVFTLQTFTANADPSSIVHIGSDSTRNCENRIEYLEDEVIKQETKNAERVNAEEFNESAHQMKMEDTNRSEDVSEHTQHPQNIPSHLLTSNNDEIDGDSDNEVDSGTVIADGENSRDDVLNVMLDATEVSNAVNEEANDGGTHKKKTVKSRTKKR